MKKRIIISIIAILLICFIWYLTLPDYKIHNSISHSNSYHNTRETELSVVVYRYWNYDELTQQIRNDFININGEPTSLKIKLFYSDWHLRNTAPFEIIEFKKNEQK